MKEDSEMKRFRVDFDLGAFIGLVIGVIIVGFAGLFGLDELKMQRDYWKTRYCEEAMKSEKTEYVRELCREILNQTEF